MRPHGISLLILLLLAAARLSAGRVAFTEDTGVIRNPGQGWSTMGAAGSFAQTDPVVNIGAVYSRPSWTTLEPERGNFNWKPLDRLLEFAASQGLPASFRIMCAHVHDPAGATPQWVFDMGAKGDSLLVPVWTKDGFTNAVRVAPVFDDPVFMAEHRRFIAALAARYDGDPRLAGLDIGSYGNWGEWHCHGLPPDTNRYMVAIAPEKRPPTKPIVYPFEIRRQYADWYLTGFRKTPLVAMTDDWEVLRWMLGESTPARVGIRRDGVSSPHHFTRWIGKPPYDAIPQMADIWKDRPVWFEFFDAATAIQRNGWDIPYSVEWMLSNHVSVVNTCPFNPWEVKDNADLMACLKKLDLYAGARLVPGAAEVLRKGRTVSVRLIGKNRGVARIHLPYVLQLVVVGPDGRERYVHDASVDPGTWLPGPFRFAERFEVPDGIDLEGARLVARLRHRHGVLRDFRFAARETEENGSLPMGPLP